MLQPIYTDSLSAMNRPGSTGHFQAVGIDVFELYRRDTASRVVAQLGAVEHFDVIEDNGAGILPNWVDLVANPLALEQRQEALGHGVVVAVAALAHAADQVVAVQKNLLIMAHR